MPLKIYTIFYYKVQRKKTCCFYFYCSSALMMYFSSCFCCSPVNCKPRQCFSQTSIMLLILSSFLVNKTDHYNPVCFVAAILTISALYFNVVTETQVTHPRPELSKSNSIFEKWQQQPETQVVVVPSTLVNVRFQ